jgi:hypothetical protein
VHSIGRVIRHGLIFDVESSVIAGTFEDFVKIKTLLAERIKNSHSSQFDSGIDENI